MDVDIAKQIDYMLTDNKQIVKAVSVLNRFSTDSDHPLVVSTIELRMKVKKQAGKKTTKASSQIDSQRKEMYRSKLERKLNVDDIREVPLEDMSNIITNVIIIIAGVGRKN